MIGKKLVFLGALFAASIAQGYPSCGNLSLEMFPAAYDLVSNHAPTFAVRVTRNDSSKGCPYYIAFEYGTAGSYSARHLSGLMGGDQPVQIYRDSAHNQILKNNSDASATEVISGTFVANSGPSFQDKNYYVVFSPNPYGRYGFYSETFIVRLYRGVLGDSNQEDLKTLTLTYNQQKNIDLSLVPTGGVFDAASTSQTMDFGNMVAGASKSVDLLIGYNAGYRLAISSLNNGRMKHQTLADQIDYTFKLNGTTIALTSGTVNRPAVFGVSPAGGLRLPVNVTIGSLTGKSGGNYADTITFSVVSAE